MYKSYPVLIITGATATGKTELSIKIARTFKKLGYEPEIISADSGQVYREMNIGTNKTPEAYRKEFPHHLIDIIYPSENFSAFMFVQKSAEIIKRGYSTTEKFIPLIVGGTMFYIEALLKGLVPQGQPNEALRKELQGKDKEELFSLLREKDPEYSKRISPNDRKRIIRALEYILETGGRYSEALDKRKPLIETAPFIVLTETTRGELKEKIKNRTLKMLEMGWIEETRKIAEKYGFNCPGLNQVGYTQIKEFLIKGNIKKPELASKIYTATWHVAKRQITFSKRFKEFTPKRILPTSEEQIQNIVRSFLSFRTPFLLL